MKRNRAQVLFASVSGLIALVTLSGCGGGSQSSTPSAADVHACLKAKHGIDSSAVPPSLNNKEALQIPISMASYKRYGVTPPRLGNDPEVLPHETPWGTNVYLQFFASNSDVSKTLQAIDYNGGAQVQTQVDDLPVVAQYGNEWFNFPGGPRPYEEPPELTAARQCLGAPPGLNH